MTMSKVAPAMPTRIAAVTPRRCSRPDRKRQIDDRGDHQHAGDQHPRHALAEPPEHRQPDAVDDPRPQEFEIVGEEDEREGGDRRLVDAVLLQARGQRRADHRVGKARRDAEEQGRERRGFGVGPDARRKRLRQPRVVPQLQSSPCSLPSPEIITQS
jgi:hypothetical protein